MKGRCDVRFNSTMDKHGVRMFMERDVLGAKMTVSFDHKKNKVLLTIEKDLSGYNDRSTIVVAMERDTAEDILKRMTEGTL